MRGKHANAAKNRRDRDELEQRAKTAERRAEQLEKELAQHREATDRRLASLSAEIRAITAERDEAASPALRRAEEELKRADRERERLRGEVRVHEKVFTRLLKNYATHLANSGLSGEQLKAADEALSKAVEWERFNLTAESYAGKAKVPRLSANSAQ